jgi:hypothetical protein
MPALSENLYFITGTDANGNPIKASSLTYPPAHSGVQTYYTEKVKGDGYYGGQGLNTVTYVPWYEGPGGQHVINNFIGDVIIEASLATDPLEGDWFPISSTATTFDTLYHVNTFYNFTGNFVWIRAKVDISAGVLTSILYNH